MMWLREIYVLLVVIVFSCNVSFSQDYNEQTEAGLILYSKNSHIPLKGQIENMTKFFEKICKNQQCTISITCGYNTDERKNLPKKRLKYLTKELNKLSKENNNYIITLYFLPLYNFDEASRYINGKPGFGYTVH